MHAHMGTFMPWHEVREQITAVSLPCGAWELNSGLRSWQQSSLPTEPCFNSVELKKQYCGMNSVPFLLRVLLLVIVPKSDSTKSWFCLLLVL